MVDFGLGITIPNDKMLALISLCNHRYNVAVPWYIVPIWILDLVYRWAAEKTNPGTFPVLRSMPEFPNRVSKLPVWH